MGDCFHPGSVKGGAVSLEHQCGRLLLEQDLTPGQGELAIKCFSLFPPSPNRRQRVRMRKKSDESAMLLENPALNLH
jgi:hypothetical protein